MDELNNQIILLRKSLKSIINQTKINLVKKIKHDENKSSKNVEKKKSELLCFGKIKSSDIPLRLALHPDKLQKTLTNSNEIEINRGKFGVEIVENFLKKNEKNVKKSSLKRVITVLKTESSAATSETNSKSNDGSKKSKKLKTGEHDQATKKSVSTIDSFFIASNGENYHASILPNESSESSSDEKKIMVPKVKEFIKEQPLKKRKKAVEAVDRISDDLHPSWKAKQSMKKNILQEFKGTKIKFDD